VWCVRVHIYIHVCVYAYTHTHTHTYSMCVCTHIKVLDAQIATAEICQFIFLLFNTCVGRADCHGGDPVQRAERGDLLIVFVF
jgi:hypothetical protein